MKTNPATALRPRPGVLGALSLLVPCLALAATPARPVQRMLLAPGCYVLAPGVTIKASAYCLDREAAVPERGARLKEQPPGLPGGLNDAVLRSGSETMSLGTGIVRGLVTVESRGNTDYFHLGLRNLGAAPLQLCVRSPTVVTVPGVGAAPDIAAIANQIETLLPPLAAPKLGSSAPVYGEPDEIHARIQEAIWAAAAKARDRSALPLDPKTRPQGAACPTPEAAIPDTAVPGDDATEARVTLACRP